MISKNNDDLTFYILEDECGEEYLITNGDVNQVEDAIDLADYDEDPDNVRDELGFDGAIEHYLEKKGLIVEHLPVEKVSF